MIKRIKLDINKFKIDIKNINDERGTLIPIEALKDVPFEIKRVYFLLSKEVAIRGSHGHKKLDQAILCLSGSMDLILDDGKNKKKLKISSSDQIILINRMIWHELVNFSQDCVLAVFASAYFDEKDYIRNHEEFIRIVKKNEKN